MVPSVPARALRWPAKAGTSPRSLCPSSQLCCQHSITRSSCTPPSPPSVGFSLSQSIQDLFQLQDQIALTSSSRAVLPLESFHRELLLPTHQQDLPFATRRPAPKSVGVGGPPWLGPCDPLPSSPFCRIQRALIPFYRTHPILRITTFGVC